MKIFSFSTVGSFFFTFFLSFFCFGERGETKEEEEEEEKREEKQGFEETPKPFAAMFLVNWYVVCLYLLDPRLERGKGAERKEQQKRSKQAKRDHRPSISPMPPSK